MSKFFPTGYHESDKFILHKQHYRKTKSSINIDVDSA